LVRGKISLIPLYHRFAQQQQQTVQPAADYHVIAGKDEVLT